MGVDHRGVFVYTLQFVDGHVIIVNNTEELQYMARKSRSHIVGLRDKHTKTK